MGAKYQPPLVLHQGLKPIHYIMADKLLYTIYSIYFSANISKYIVTLRLKMKFLP